LDASGFDFGSVPEKFSLNRYLFVPLMIKPYIIRCKISRAEYLMGIVKKNRSNSLEGIVAVVLR